MACLEGWQEKKNIAAQLRFANLHPKKPQDFWNNVLWTDGTNVEMILTYMTLFISTKQLSGTVMDRRWCGLVK